MSEQTLTARDIELIVEALTHRAPHTCRFPDVTPKELAETLEFCRKMNEAMNDTKRIVRRSFVYVVLGVVGTIICTGTVVTVKGWLK